MSFTNVEWYLRSVFVCDPHGLPTPIPNVIDAPGIAANAIALLRAAEIRVFRTPISLPRSLATTTTEFLIGRSTQSLHKEIEDKATTKSVHGTERPLRIYELRLLVVP